MNCLERIAACVLIALSVGCGAPGMIRATAVEGTLRRVIERHEIYTKDNDNLSNLQRRVDLRDGELLSRVLDEALEKEKVTHD